MVGLRQLSSLFLSFCILTGSGISVFQLADVLTGSAREQAEQLAELQGINICTDRSISYSASFQDLEISASGIHVPITQIFDIALISSDIDYPDLAFIAGNEVSHSDVISVSNLPRAPPLV